MGEHNVIWRNLTTSFSLVMIMTYLKCRSPLSMGFLQAEHWSQLPCPPPGYLSDLGINPSLVFPTSGRFFTTSATWGPCMYMCWVRLFASLWTIARKAPLSMGFSRQEYWNGLPFPSPGNLPDPLEELDMEPRSAALQADWEAPQFLVSKC